MDSQNELQPNFPLLAFGSYLCSSLHWHVTRDGTSDTEAFYSIEADWLERLCRGLHHIFVIDVVWGFMRLSETPEASWIESLARLHSDVKCLVFPPCFIVTCSRVWTMILRMKTAAVVLLVCWNWNQQYCYNCSWPLNVNGRVSLWSFFGTIMKSSTRLRLPVDTHHRKR